MKTAKLLITTFALSILISALSPAANAIGITPLRGFLTAAPGETVEGSVIAQNTTDEQQIVVLSKSDFFVGEDESVQFMPEVKEDNPYSMQEWITFPENDVVTEPKGGAEMKYSITVPENAKSQGYYAAIFVQGKPVTAGAGAVSVGASVAHLVLLEVTGDLKSDLAFKNYTLTGPDAPEGDAELKQQAKFETVVYNTGNTHKAPDGKIVIYSSDKTVKEELLINRDQYNAMPNRNKTLGVNLDYTKYEAGKYFGELNLKLSDEKTYEAYIPFTVKEDRTLQIEKVKEGKLSDEAIQAAQEQVQAQPALISPEWIPWVIGGGIGLLFVLIFVIEMLRRKKSSGKKNK